MKHQLKNFCILLLISICSVLFSCDSKNDENLEPLGNFVLKEDYWYDAYPPSFAPHWNTKNNSGLYYYYTYTITKAPEKYKEYIWTTVYYPENDGYSVGDMWKKKCEESILLALDYEQFHFFDMDNRSYICLDINLNEKPFKLQEKPTIEDVKNDIYYILSKKYVGFKDMKNRGFSKEIWKSAKTYEEMTDLLDKYVNDSHLSIKSSTNFNYRKSQKFDEGTNESTDPQKTYIVKETSNTYYIRCNDCDKNWPEYNDMPLLADKAKNKDFIVLDFRSNHGGSNYPQLKFFQNLRREAYKGTVYILQDNWSYSSGETWEIACGFVDDFNCKLVGTHSGGMQFYGNCRTVNIKSVSAWVASKSFIKHIPNNYLGEGIGYEPEIWATTENMKTVLEGLGLDLSDIIFK